VAGLLGWVAGGPAGGIAGFIAGAVFDNIRVHPFVNVRKPSLGAFSISLLTLMAVVVQADGTALRSELDYVKCFLRQNFGVTEQKEALHTLQELLQLHPSVPVACQQVRRFLDRQECVQLTSFLFELAAIDRPLSEAERQVLNVIAVHLGVNRGHAATSRQNTSIDAAYAELGIGHQASIKEIKQAYRMLAVKYHPDKAAYLGEQAKTAAGEQFLKINRAYELIKKERHFS
jgi:DnaJ like chaperone protein